MSDLERRLRESRPPMIEPSAETGARLAKAVLAPPARGRRSPEGWRRGVPRTRGGRLLGVALLVLGAGTAAAIASGILSRGSAPEPAAAAPSPPAAWGTPVVLDGGISRVPRPEVAMDNAGAAMVAWSPGGSVSVTHRPRGGAWTKPLRLSTAGVPTGDPALALARDGRTAVVVWRERRGADLDRRVLRLPDGSLAGVITRRVGGEYVLVARRWRADAGWAAPVEVSPPGHNARDMVRPRVVADDGGFLIAWTRADALEARTFSPAGDLGALEEIAPTSGGQPVGPFLASDGRGRAVLAWGNRIRSADRAPGTYAVEAATRDTSGWTPSRALAEGSVNDPRPAAAVSVDGDAVVAWVDSSGGRQTRIAASRTSGAGSWEAPVALSAPGRAAFGPSVAIDGRGTIVAHWSVGAATQFTSAGTRGPWAEVQGGGSSGLTYEGGRTGPALVGDGAGRLVAAFGSRPGALVRDWRPAGTFGPPARALGETGWQYGLAGLAASPSGSAAAVVTGFGLKGTWGKGWDVRVVVREAPGGARPEGGR